MDGELLADQPLGEKLIKKGFWLYFFMFLTAPVSYLIKAILSNKLGIADVGLFYSIFGFVGLISIYNDLGLTEALQYFLPKYWIEKKYNHYKTVFYLTIIVQLLCGVLVAGLMYRGADRLAIHHFRSPDATHILRIFCRYFIGINFLNVFNSIYIAFQDTIATNLTDFFRLYGTLAFTIIFWLSNALTPTSFSMIWIIGMSIGIVTSSIIFIKKYHKTLRLGKIDIKRDLIKSQFKYALRVFLGTNAVSLFGQIDQQIVINFLGPIQAGYYTNFRSLVGMYGVITSPIITFMFPIVTELITKEEHGKLKLLQNILYKYFSVFALTISGLFFAFGPELVSVFFGVKFTYSGTLLMYISPILIINILIGINYSILAGLGKVRVRVKILSIALLVNIALNGILILYAGMGLIGAVIALGIGWIVLRRLSLRIVHKHEAIQFDWKYLGINLIVVCVLSISLYIGKSHIIVLDDMHRFSNIGYLAILIGIYYGIIGLFNYTSIRNLIKEVRPLKNTFS